MDDLSLKTNQFSLLYFWESCGGEAKTLILWTDVKKYLERPTDEVFIEKL